MPIRDEVEVCKFSLTTIEPLCERHVDMPLGPGTMILGGRYKLAAPIDLSAQPQVWEVHNQYDAPYLLKMWSFQQEQPDEFERALWDLELRHLSRLSNRPDAEARLVTLVDAGIDLPLRLFAMVLTAPGLEPLEKVLERRQTCAWLRDLKQPAKRTDLWKGVRALAQGLTLLHEQNILHRAITASSVFVDSKGGPDSMRLGGFEWSVQVASGRQPLRAQPNTLLPPEFSDSTGVQIHSFESDWFLFGALVARLVAGATPAPGLDPEGARNKIIELVRAQQALHDSERDLVEHLLTKDPQTRLARGSDILQAIRSVLQNLERPARLQNDAYLGLVVLLGPTQSITAAIMDLDPNIKALDFEGQRAFIEADLQGAEIVQSSGQTQRLMLQGRRGLTYQLAEHDPDHQGDKNWSLAFSSGLAYARSNGKAPQSVPLRFPPIRVFTTSSARYHEAHILANAVSWRPYLPPETEDVRIGIKLRRLHDFLRITNQIELLLKDAEIFAYEVVKRSDGGVCDELVIRGVEKERPPLKIAVVPGGLIAFLRRLEEEEARDGNLVYLSDSDALKIGGHVPPTAFWSVIELTAEDTVRVQRLRGDTPYPPAPDRGYLRAKDLLGQIKLIERRKEAIEDLGQRAYLLRAMVSPDFCSVDTGEPLPLPIDDKKIDAAKAEAMRHIWRARPLFALQGPPGTGKTTLVANLLAQVFEHDHVAQVLVTAQAHAAVDVLRKKVQEALSPRNSNEMPLAVRLTNEDLLDEKTSKTDPDSVRPVTKRVLSNARTALKTLPKRTRIQNEWLSTIEDAIQGIDHKNGSSVSRDLCALVKRAANITYCTSTSGDLAQLAQSTQSFDWAIIEEAGKAHGFDLVLPLQTGCRWLLIGDQNQLSPYRYDDFAAILRSIDDTILALSALPERGSNIVDTNLINDWQEGFYKDKPEEKSETLNTWKNWLKFFEQLHSVCFQAFEAAPEWSDKRVPIAGMLYTQHRMHKTIADLVSTAYYDRAIESATVIGDTKNNPGELGQAIDNAPTIDTQQHREDVKNPFVIPVEIAGKSIVWIDIPSALAGADETTRSSSVEVSAVRQFLTSLEVSTSFNELLKLAILSPYRAQLDLLRGDQGIKDFLRAPPRWVKQQSRESKPKYIHTVDSFQGSEADIVIVSLVRNNCKAPGTRGGLGFLDVPERMNVAFSRAARLLVLVGSFDFFQYQLREVPSLKTWDQEELKALRAQPLGTWRIVLDYLQTCFNNGRAVRIQASELRKKSS